MTTTKFLLRTLAVAIAMFALGFVGHQLLLGHDYVAIEPIMRSKQDLQAHMPFALISCFCFSAALVWMYSQGRNSKPWLGQGMRFGAAVWAIASLPLYLTNYVIEPWPGAFVAKILAWEFVAMLVLGVLTARMAKSDSVA
ncbi:MAG TPA: hypothetical protein VEI52_11065 [Terriglobales bacterium]|nr:hypothetical protein [Terriglobales bacterium]